MSVLNKYLFQDVNIWLKNVTRSWKKWAKFHFWANYPFKQAFGRHIWTVLIKKKKK